MINLYNEYIKPNYKTTSARKTVLSLMWNGCDKGIYEASPTFEENTSPYDEIEQVDRELASVNPKSLDIEKYEKEISMLNKKIEEHSNTLYHIKSYISDLNKLKTENNAEEYIAEYIYNILKDYLLKRIFIQVNGSDIQGILTEITPMYIKLIEDEYIVVVPLTKIDFVKFSL